MPSKHVVVNIVYTFVFLSPSPKKTISIIERTVRLKTLLVRVSRHLLGRFSFAGQNGVDHGDPYRTFRYSPGNFRFFQEARRRVVSGRKLLQFPRPYVSVRLEKIRRFEYVGSAKF